ncbi:hypothetical protein [Streptomyces sp. NPDC005244]|uniref:hypothetical protein n=1 Tax=Streptomyces sp. NPDC005244 TaxID=3364708 RepID=UPI00367F7338
MTYTPRPGDIGLTQMSGVGGKAIRLAQWLAGDGFRDYEHAFVWVGEYTDMIVEAMPGGAKHVPNWHDPERTIYLRCPDEHRDAVAAAALALRGTPYSWADYAAIAAHRLRIPAPHLERYIEASGHLMCAQLADRAADRGGWHLFDDRRWVGDVTPGDLTRLAERQPGGET